MNREDIIKLIDFTKLKRDYIKNPLGKKDPPYKEDLEYLYLELNLDMAEIADFLNYRTIFKYFNFYKIKKPKNLLYQCRARKNIEKYGYAAPAQDPKIKAKVRENNIKKYGVPSPNSLDWKKEKAKQTCLEKYGTINPFQNEAIKEKARITNLERYGYEHASSSPEIKKKVKETNLERFGYEYISQSPQVKQACKERTLQKIEELISKEEFYNAYIVENLSIQDMCNKYGLTEHFFWKAIEYFQIEKSRGQKIQAWQNSILKTKEEHFGDPYYNNREKAKNTTKERYGVENYTQTSEYNVKLKEISLLRYGYENPNQSPIIQEKIYQTKKAHNTFNSSKPEESIYNLLLEKFPDCIHTYKDKERYPFLCDFYIPSLDLFIEYQGIWTHGGHPYNPEDPKDLETVKSWEVRSKELNHKGKPKNFYKGAIYTWTVRDPLKRETARANYLNYLEFFNEEEFLAWYDNFENTF